MPKLNHISLREGLNYYQSFRKIAKQRLNG
jgi:hypothetical protein